MAIYTRFGTPVTINDVSVDEQGTQWVKVTNHFDDGTTNEREYPIWELRADGGISEIHDEIDNVQFAKDCIEDERRSFHQ